MSRNQIIIMVVGGLLILLGIPLTLYLVSQSQDTRSRASDVVYPDNTSVTTTDSTARTQQTCDTPQQPEDVFIEYPHIEGDNFDLTQANCSWEDVPGASNYNITITEVDTESVIRDETIPASTTRVVFGVTQDFTYLCEVSAVNTCGDVSSVASVEQVCSIEGLEVSPTPAEEPTPTPEPTTPPADPTAPPAEPTTPIKEATSAPTPPPTGTTETLLVGGAVAGIIATLGAFLLIW